MIGDEFSDRSEGFLLTTTHQHQLNEESHDLLACALEDLEDFDDLDTQWGQQQYQLFQTLPDANQDLNMRPKSVMLQTIQAVSRVEERLKSSSDVPLLDSVPLLPVPEAVCQMVEDPYFDTHLSSPSAEEAPTEDSEWIHSPLFSPPSVFLNDQEMGPSSPVSGKAECISRLTVSSSSG